MFGLPWWRPQGISVSTEPCEVLTTCPSCEDKIAVAAGKVHAELHPDRPDLNRLIYPCPSCRQPQRHDLSAEQWQFLARTMHPGELFEVVMPRGLVSRFCGGPPPLTRDDLLDFALELNAWETTP